MRKTTIAFWVFCVAVAMAFHPAQCQELLGGIGGLLFFWMLYKLGEKSGFIPSGEEIDQAKHDVALRKYVAVRNKIEKDLVKGFREPGTVTAKYEKQPIFETDGYESIVHRVAEEEAFNRGIWNDAQSWSRWNGSQYGEYSKTMFKVDVGARANSIILDRLTRESDRVVHAAIDFAAEEVKQRKSRKNLDGV
jgi:hypothetical protein